MRPLTSSMMLLQWEILKYKGKVRDLERTFGLHSHNVVTSGKKKKMLARVRPDVVRHRGTYSILHIILVDIF